MTSISSIGTIYSSQLLEKLTSINEQLEDIPTILDYETLQNFQNGEYDITLKEYTDLNIYRTMMTAAYGDSSSSSSTTLSSSLCTYLGLESGSSLTSEEFIEKLEEQGISSQTALKMYTALKSYNSLSTMLGYTNSYVSAKI